MPKAGKYKKKPKKLYINFVIKKSTCNLIVIKEKQAKPQLAIVTKNTEINSPFIHQNIKHGKLEEK
jgi:hypothetical protein